MVFWPLISSVTTARIVGEIIASLALKGEWQGSFFVITARDMLGALNGQIKLSPTKEGGLRISVTGEAGLPQYGTINGTPQ